MRRVLLIVDLEGVAGVDRVSDLAGTSPTYRDACTLLAREIDAAARGFRAAGFDRIVVSDSHRAGVGAPNVRAEELESALEVVYADDAYADTLLAEADAIACLGMHAAAGTEGFAAHTVSVQSAWRSDRKLLSETDIVLGLAAEREIPVIFVSGDDVLGRHTSRDIRYVPLKVSLDRRRARSCSPEDARRQIEEVAASPPTLPPRVSPELSLTFKSRWQADIVAAAGALRVDDRTVRIEEATFSAAYRRAIALQELTEPPLRDAVRTFHPAALAEDCVGLLVRSFSTRQPRRTTDAARRALPVLFDDRYAESSWRRADRALTFHMLEHHAPAFFATHDLEPAARRAFDALALVPSTFTIDLSPTEAMARMDALYLQHVRGTPFPDADHIAIAATIRSIARSNVLFAWLLDELAVSIGTPRTLELPPRALRSRSRVPDLYWLTHLFLLETTYLRRPFVIAGREAWVEELFLATDYVVANNHVDIAAEMAICLQLVGEEDTTEHRALVALVERHQTANGGIVDPSVAHDRRLDSEDAIRIDSHTTSAALVALARA